MTALPITNDFAEKLAPLNAESWSAWRLGECESDPITLNAPATLDEAVSQALAALCWQPKDTLAVLYTHAGLNKRSLWLFEIKRSTKRYRWRPAYDGGRPVKVAELEPSLRLQTAVAAFEPIERFRVTRETTTAEIVGLDPALVEQG